MASPGSSSLIYCPCPIHRLSELYVLVLFIYLFNQFRHQVPFEPAKAIFAGMDILIAVRIISHFSAAFPYILDAPGSQWCQLELRCAHRLV
jgi:hypothetical protein